MKFPDYLKYLKYFVGSFLLGVLSLQNVFAQAKNSSPATQFVVSYGNEFTFGLCILILLLSSWLSIRLPTDETIKPELSLQAKVLAALTGGILAFIYSLHRDQGLTLMNPIWMFVASIAFPVTILTLRSKFKRYTEIMDLSSNQQNKGE